MSFRCFLIFLVASLSSGVQAASAVGHVRLLVTQALSIISESTLTFPAVSAGAPPGNVRAEDPGAAVFSLSGEPGKAYFVRLPAQAVLKNTASEKTDSILIHDFVSFPAVTGTLGSGGTSSVRIGASRDALTVQQAPGQYEGTFTVEIIY